MKSFTNRLCRLLLLMGFAAVANGAWATYGLTGSSCMGLSNSFTAMTNDQYTFTATCSGSQWFRLYNGSIAEPNSCKLGSLASGGTAELSTAYATTQPGTTFQYNINLTKDATYTFTMSGSTLTITTSTATYTVTPSITGGAISPSTAQSVTSGSSVSFTVTPTSGYSFSSATYSGTKSGDIVQSSNTFTLTPTSSGTLSIVYALVSTYTITTSGTNCSFSETSKAIAEGGSFDFVVTPNEGYKLVSANCTNAECSPTDLGGATTATTITVSNPTSAGTLTVVTAAISSSRTPTVRIGAMPSISDSDCGITANAYFAQRGCENIDLITLYYSNNLSFRVDGSNKTLSVEKSVSSPTINTSAEVTLTSAQVSEVVSPGDMLYLRFTAHNSNGTSSYSDILPITYTCSKFITQDLSVDFTACPSAHQFDWSEMFISPAPTTWDVTLSGSDAKSDFTLSSDGTMTWNTDGKDQTSYTYTFTAHADGYADATATLTVSYTVPSGSVTGSITGVTASPETTAESPTKPYTEVALTAEGTTGNIELIDWTVTPATAEIYSQSGNTLPATASFKAQSRTSKTTYTVTATGYTSTCASVSESTTVVVAPDVTEDCE